MIVEILCIMLDKDNRRTSGDGGVTVAKYECSEGDTSQTVDLLRAITQIGNKSASLLREMVVSKISAVCIIYVRTIFSSRSKYSTGRIADISRHASDNQMEILTVLPKDSMETQRAQFVG